MILLANFGEKNLLLLFLIFQMFSTMRTDESCLICEYTGKGYENGTVILVIHRVKFYQYPIEKDQRRASLML